MTQETEREALLRDMRVQVAWTDEARMPIPLYERVKAFISTARLGKGEAKPVEVWELIDTIQPHAHTRDIAQAILSRYNEE